MSFTHEVTTIVEQSLAIVFAVLVIVLALRRQPTRRRISAVSGLVVAAAVIVLAAGQVQKGIRQLRNTRKTGVSTETGRTACLAELPPSPDLFTVRIPFSLWLRTQMRAGDTYTLPSFTRPPDQLCLYLVLLPALPAVPGERPTWTIAFGSIGPAMRARIASHDSAVRVYAPGFAIQADGQR